MSNDNICYFSHGDQRYPIEIAPFYRAPQQVKDYWRAEDSYLLPDNTLAEDSYLLPDNTLVVWVEYKDQYYAAQYLSDLRQEFMALTCQVSDRDGVPF